MKQRVKNKPPGNDFVKNNSSMERPVSINKFYELIGFGLIILIGVIIYSNSFNCSFNFDDDSNIVKNLKIRNLWNIKDIWDNSHNRFIAFYTFAINYHFGKLDVFGYHLFNLIIHIINAFLIYWLTWLILSSPVLKDDQIVKHKKWIALVTALLFISHPLATQSVTYIIQRLASMVTMFYLLSLACYVKGRLTDNSKFLKYLMFACSLISAVLAMLTKENAFTIPFAILLFEIMFFKKSSKSINFKDYRYASGEVHL